jgi:hypothetical protein
MTRAVLPALALAVAGTAVAPAGAATGVRTAELTVQLEGVQKTTWEKHHFSEGGCDVPIDGSGSETYRFRSAKLRVRAYWTSAGVVLSGPAGEPLLRLKGSVQRQGTIVVGPGEVCSYGDGTGEAAAPLPSDCGMRKLRSTAAIGFAGKPDDLVIIAPGLNAPKDPFANCPTGASEQFPGLLAFDDASRRIGRRLPARDLFRYGQNLVVAQGTRTSKGGDTTASTSIRWTATFTRVKR